MSFCLLQVFGCFEHFSALNYLATKTPYEEPKLSSKNIRGLEQCSVIHINHLGRHGSRYQVKFSELENLNALVTQAGLESALTRPHGLRLAALLKNTLKIENPSNRGQLTEQGKNEQRGIAARMYEDFPELFSKSSPDKPILLEHTYINRTKDSLMAFLESLSAHEPNLTARARIISHEQGSCDSHLRFFDGCNAYKKYTHEHKYTSIIEKAIWQPEAHQEIKNILSRVFSANFVTQLSTQKQKEIARNIYSLCQLDADIDKNKLEYGFCSFFTKASEIEYFNWQEDALNYFSKGFAGENNHIAHRIACSLVDNFITTTDQAITSKNAPIANLRFAHAETVIPFIVQLGLYRQDSIADMFKNPNERKFRTALISPMAANIQWILYQCPQNNYRVRMLFNENNISFPIEACKNKAWCSWSIIKEYLTKEKRNCSENAWATEICEGTSCKRRESLSSTSIEPR